MRATAGCRQRGSQRRWQADGTARSTTWCRSLGWLGQAVAEIEEGRPANETPVSATPTSEIDRSLGIGARVTEDEPDEWLAFLVACEIGAIGRANLTAAEPVGYDRELDGNVRLLVALVELSTTLQHVLDNCVIAGQRQVFMKDDPLVVPSQHWFVPHGLRANDRCGLGRGSAPLGIPVETHVPMAPI